MELEFDVHVDANALYDYMFPFLRSLFIIR